MYLIAVLLVAAASGTSAQLTAQSSVAPELRECYTNVTLINRNNLPPTTMPVLIDIIRKIEDNPNVNTDLRMLAVLLLHTYRQDGIEYHEPVLSANLASNVLPYAPTFHSFHRHRLLLSRIIPGNLQVLENNTIPSDLKCAMHFMLSTTVDARLRNDESICNQLSQYRALRTVRQAYSLNEDVEILDPALLNADKNGQIKQYNPDEDVEFTGSETSRNERQVLGESLCPLLGGVVHTAWGDVSAGHLIAGIAAGAQSQQIPVLELAKGGVLNFQNVQQSVTAIYPATLSGDLAEAVLIQGIERGSTSIAVGSTGNWNSTQARKHYLLQSRNNIEMTDPEMRGDIDGFVLGIRSNSFGSFRLSQLLDMYYSPRNGVLDPTLRACNRRTLVQTAVTASTLASETYAFAAALDSNMALRGTLTGGLDTLVSNAVENFQSYMTSNLNNLDCDSTDRTSLDYHLRTNLYIVLDSSWEYQTVYPAISYLLDRIEVSKFGSSVTLLSAFDGSIIVNKTFSLADFHTAYTLTRHQAMFTGVNLLTTLTNIKTLMHNELEHERTINYVGGNSTVLLFLLNTGNLQNNEQVWEQARIINETVPDLRILFATSTNLQDTLWNLVRDMHNDIIHITLPSTNTVDVADRLNLVLDRIQTAARRIINPTCGSTYNIDTLSGTRVFDDFVEPGYINFYSISPNYFYQSNDNRRIRITRSAAGVGSLVICHSRRIVQPRQNSTIQGLDEDSVTCHTLTTGNVEISLRDACSDAWTINSCPFFYLSVQSSTGGQAATATVCSDRACRFPYDIRYQVAIEDFGCFSSASGIGASLVFILTAFALHLFRWF